MLQVNQEPSLFIRSATLKDWGLFAIFVAAGFGLYFAVSSLISLVAIGADGEIAPWTIPAIGLANFLCLGGVFVGLGIGLKHVNLTDVGLKPLRWEWLWILSGSAVAIGIIPLRGALALAVQLLIEGDLESVAARGDLFTSGGFSLSAFLLTLLGVGILAPISEELFFRGLLHTWTMKYVEAFWIRGLITSTLFGIAHLDSIGVAVSAFVMGWVIAWMYERTRSILMPIVIHIATNSTAVALLYLSLWAIDAGLIPAE
jgi:membrane protease YdiL (CAAX protease family)